MKPLILALLCSAASVQANADQTYDSIIAHHKVRVGVNLSGLPFGAYKPGTQQPVGFAVDLANDIGRKLGVEAEVVPVVAANRALFLKQGKVDLLIANMTVTPERAEQLDYVPTPYEQLGGALVAKKGSGIQRWEDLAGKVVCISQGASFQQPLTERYKVQLKAYRSQSEVLLALKGASCDAVVINSPIMHELIRKPEWAGFDIPINEDLVPADSVIWLRQGQADTRALLDRIVRDWHASGWLLSLAGQYRMQPSALVTQLHEQYKGQPALAVPVVPPL